MKINWKCLILKLVFTLRSLLPHLSKMILLALLSVKYSETSVPTTNSCMTVQIKCALQLEYFLKAIRKTYFWIIKIQMIRHWDSAECSLGYVWDNGGCSRSAFILGEEMRNEGFLVNLLQFYSCVWRCLCKQINAGVFPLCRKTSLRLGSLTVWLRLRATLMLHHLV